MASTRNYEKDTYKIYYDQEKKDNRKSRSSSKKKNESKPNAMLKSSSVAKENINSPYGSQNGNNNLNMGMNNNQNIPNNININVNNLIINNTSNPPNMNIYPNNYGLYLSNSSMFSKLGNDIVNSKMNNNNNNNIMSNFNKKYQPYMSNKLSSNNTSSMSSNISGVKVNLNVLNSLINNNQGGNAMGNSNINNSASYLKGSYNADNNSYNSNNSINPQISKKFPNLVKDSLVDNVINNVLDHTKKQGLGLNTTQSKNNASAEPHMENEKDNYSSSDYKLNSSINSNNNNNSNNMNMSNSSNSNLDISIKQNSPLTSDNTNVIIVSEDILDRHVALWGYLIDLELFCDNKQSLSLISKKFMNHFSDEILKKNLNFDIFSNTVLNKTYSKLFKTASIMLIYFKFVFLDFNYESNLKSSIKKLVNCLNEQLLGIIDNFVLIKESVSEKISKDFMEKYSKIIKNHKIKKNKDAMNVNNLFKNLEIAVNGLKQFSNNFFKIGYFKPIHSICLDFFRLIETFSLNNLLSLIINNVLYYIMMMSNINNSLDKKSGMISTKTIIFNPNTFMGVNTNVTAPFLPTVGSDAYTLVLDLDETLVHFFFTPSGGTFLIRPGCFEFLQMMSEKFEVVIFTAAMKDYADNILDVLDKERTLIKHRDLSKTGRDMAKIIIIDNLPENFKLQQNNGLFIKTWNDDMKDTQLYDFSKILKDLVAFKVPDVRVVIKKLKEEVNKRFKKNSLNPYANIDISKFM